jgi:hypothetical protein
MFKSIVGIIMSISGFLGMLGSAIAMRFWLITVVIMVILKLTGVLVIPWFAGPFTAGAISTGLWILTIGLLFMVISFTIAALGIKVLDD